MKKAFFIFELSICIATAHALNAETRYVDSRLSSDCTSSNYSIANRNCTGTDGNGYKTLGAGVRGLTPGDTLYVRAGTYNEATNQFILPSGTSGSHITISGYSTETATITSYPWRWYGAGGDSHGAYYVDMTKLTFSGNNSIPYFGCGGQDPCKTPNYCSLSYSEVIGTPTSEGITVSGAYHSFTHNKIHDINVGGSGWHAFYVKGSHSDFSYNEIYNVSHGGIKLGNSSYSTATIDEVTTCVHDGVTYYTCDNTVHHNIIHDFSMAGAGFAVGTDPSGLSSAYHKIYNNIFYNSHATVEGEGKTLAVINLIEPRGHVEVYNNTIYNTSVQDGISNKNYLGVGLVVRNNIVWGCGGNAPINMTRAIDPVVDHNLTTDPGFVNERLHNFHLQSTSQAIGAGANLSAWFTTDFDGVARPSEQAPWAAGAFEYSATRNIQAPANLRLSSITK